MKLSDLTVEVRNKDLSLAGQIRPEDLSLTAKVIFNNVGSWALDLSPDHSLAPVLRTPGAGIVVTGPNGSTLFSGPVDKPTYETSVGSPGGDLTFEGVTDDIILKDYLAIPDPTNSDLAGQALSHDKRTGTAETIMHQYVDANIGPDAPASRRREGLVMGANGDRGPVITKAARFKVLGNLLTEIAGTGDLGYRIVQVGSELVFETYEVMDRTTEIRLDIRNGNLFGEKVSITPPGATRVLVAGQEQGVERQFVWRENEVSLAAEAEWGRRIERFVDQRQTSEVDELIEAGDEVLQKEGFTITSVAAMPADDTAMQFGVDWFLGDRVSVVVDASELQAVVTGMAIQANADGFRTGALIGDPTRFNNGAAYSQRLNDVEERLNDIEKEVEVGGDDDKLDVEGGTVTGPIELEYEPEGPSDAVSKEYVDDLVNGGVMAFFGYDPADPTDLPANTHVKMKWGKTGYMQGGMYCPQPNMFYIPKTGIYRFSGRVAISPLAADGTVMIGYGKQTTGNAFSHASVMQLFALKAGTDHRESMDFSILAYAGDVLCVNVRTSAASSSIYSTLVIQYLGVLGPPQTVAAEPDPPIPPPLPEPTPAPVNLNPPAKYTPPAGVTPVLGQAPVAAQHYHSKVPAGGNVQAAMDAASAWHAANRSIPVDFDVEDNFACVELAAGTVYDIGATPLHPRRGVRVVGAGAGRNRPNIISTAASHLVNVDNNGGGGYNAPGTDWSFENIDFNGKTYAGGFSIVHTKRFQVKGCRFWNLGGKKHFIEVNSSGGARSDGTYNVVITGNEFDMSNTKTSNGEKRRTEDECVQLDYSWPGAAANTANDGTMTNNVLIFANHFHHAPRAVGSHHLENDGPDGLHSNVKIEANVFERIGPGAYGDGSNSINSEGAVRAYAWNNVHILSNSFKGCYQPVKLFIPSDVPAGLGNPDYARIAGNTFTDCEWTRYGISSTSNHASLKFQSIMVELNEVGGEWDKKPNIYFVSTEDMITASVLDNRFKPGNFTLAEEKAYNKYRASAGTTISGNTVSDGSVDNS